MMTGEEAWRLLNLAVQRLVAPIHPHERHKYTGKALYRGAEWIRDSYPEVWEEFRDVRFKAGYHR